MENSFHYATGSAMSLATKKTVQKLEHDPAIRGKGVRNTITCPWAKPHIKANKVQKNRLLNLMDENAIRPTVVLITIYGLNQQLEI